MKSSTSRSPTPPATTNPPEGEKKGIHPELWQACAGPLVNLPVAGTHVVYFPQGHSEQVAASMKNDVDSQMPNYPNLPSKLLCLLHNVTLHADPGTDEVYAQMTLQPVPSFDKEALLRSDLSLKGHKPQPDFFCKTLTASDTSTHGGFSVRKQAAEKIFPALDFSMQQPAQELVARDLHDNTWTFRHIFRGKPKRHLLTSGWSLFVSGKKLFAGDSILFVRDEKQQLLLAIRRSHRQPTHSSSSVLSSDSMHIGVLAAAAHATSNNSPFTVFYNPRASPSEFVIPLAKYYKAVYGQQISLGMRFRMMFETEESGTRRYMGTITGIGDLDSMCWKNSQWRNLQVGWDESTAVETRTRVSIWEIDPVTAPFFICSHPFIRPKRPRFPDMADDDSNMDTLFKRTMPWLGDDPQALTGLSLVQWMNMQQNPSFGNPTGSNFLNTFPESSLQNLPAAYVPCQLGFTSKQIPEQTNSQFNGGRLLQTNSLLQSQHPQFCDIPQQLRQSLINPAFASYQVQPQIMQNLISLQHSSALQNHQLLGNLSQILPHHQILGQNQQQGLIQSRLPDVANQQAQVTDSQIQLQLQLLQKLQQQQQSILSQQSEQQLVNNINKVQEQSFSRSLASNEMLDMSQIQPKLKSQPSQVPKIERSIMPEMQGQTALTTNPMSNHHSMAGQSAITDDVPSCSTSPSTNNCSRGALTIVNKQQRSNNIAMGERMSQSSASLLTSTSLETMSGNANLVKDLQQKADVEPSIDIANGQAQGILTRQTYHSIPSSQMHFLDTSSATSVSLSQNDFISQRNLLYNSQSILLADTGHEVEVQADIKHNINVGANINCQLGTSLSSEIMLTKNEVMSDINFSNNVSSECMLSNYECTKDAQQELSSSMVTKSFGVPELCFNVIESGFSDDSFMNSGAWGPPQYQQMRSYTKVYKRGAVGRSIAIKRYSGYDELKQDLACMFGIQGQMEDQGRVGWKLVYVDHENDILLVGDDPWEDFVNCVRCIKILSPQEVQQISLNGDFGNAFIPNQI